MTVDRSLIQAPRILLTSFATWQAHQRRNSSDELLAELAQLPEAATLNFFRQLPVNLPVARELTIAKINQIQPDWLVCCGMAASRTQLTVEAQAIVGEQVLKPDLDLERLTSGLPFTVVSQDAGRFVCNSLYHAMLNYLNGNSARCKVLFIHVPILTPMNREQMLQDFRQVIERLQSQRF